MERAEVLSREFQATHQDYQGLLRRMPLFATMDDEEIDLLSSRLKSEHWASGRTIIRAASPERDVSPARRAAAINR